VTTTDVLQIWLHCHHPQNGTASPAVVYWLVEGSSSVRSRVVEARTVQEALKEAVRFLCRHAGKTHRKIDLITCHRTLVSTVLVAAIGIVGATLSFQPLAEFPPEMLNFRSKLQAEAGPARKPPTAVNFKEKESAHESISS
jgi:hypothetical protein